MQVRRSQVPLAIGAFLGSLCKFKSVNKVKLHHPLNWSACFTVFQRNRGSRVLNLAKKEKKQKPTKLRSYSEEQKEESGKPATAAGRQRFSSLRGPPSGTGRSSLAGHGRHPPPDLPGDGPPPLGEPGPTLPALRLKQLPGAAGRAKAGAAQATGALPPLLTPLC